MIVQCSRVAVIKWAGFTCRDFMKFKIPNGGKHSNEDATEMTSSAGHDRALDELTRGIS